MVRRYERVKNPKSTSPFDAYRPVIYYEVSEIEELLAHLEELGYERYNTYEGVLGCGNWICVAPDEEHYHFIIREIAVNSWQSLHKIQRKSKLSKADLAEIERYETMEVAIP